ncbi:hypothetical protein ACWDQK_34685, partial [Streptomyces sp. NPDC003667]
MPHASVPHGPVARHGVYESFGPAPGAPPAAEDETQELPPVPAAPRAAAPRAAAPRAAAPRAAAPRAGGPGPGA